MMTAARIAELKALCDKATPGPWIVHDVALDHYGCDETCTHAAYHLAEASHNDCHFDIYSPAGTYEKRDYRVSGNAHFIADSRTALPEALAEIDRLRSALQQIANGKYDNPSAYAAVIAHDVLENKP